MQYAAALIEYLVTGIISLIWIGLYSSQYIDISAQNIKDYKEVIVICIFPIAYVFGIYVDVTSSYLLKRFNNFAKFIAKHISCPAYLIQVLNLIVGTSKSEPYKRSAEILSYSPSDTIKTMEAYVSRDRIARGMALNSFAIGCISIVTLAGNTRCIVISLSVAISIISILAWFRLRRLSKAFKTQALIQLSNRENKNKNKNNKPIKLD
ncbi:hypothetical protein [Pseudoalteromonas distincta]|uniref:hypothetical protein n=1 Tax=Pseudoalteromonas TaxID=53246 RepID=UPI00020A0B48|nr:hypothetical protein [Pseudoalteromonas distincta]EGI71569.1 hypothetical protein PH505_cy00220 [Pseudoalteromonas distincta]